MRGICLLFVCGFMEVSGWRLLDTSRLAVGGRVHVLGTDGALRQFWEEPNGMLSIC